MSESAAAEARLQAYTELLLRYNAALNLLSAQGARDIERLVADGKAYARAIERFVGPTAHVVDIGSGAGFPGIVIAVMLPSAAVDLVERRRRRAAFLELAVGRLAVANATVHARDVRALGGVRADVITAQAVTTLGELTRLTRHLHRDPCHLVSRRGPDWREELDGVRQVLDDEAAATAGAEGHPAPDESPSSVVVVGDSPLEQGGSLVTLRLTGGPACRSSG